MAIHSFLDDHPFEPETIAMMSEALESACKALGLSVVDDPATRLVASKIIEFTQRGLRDPATLSAAVLKDIKRA